MKEQLRELKIRWEQRHLDLLDGVFQMDDLEKIDENLHKADQLRECIQDLEELISQNP